MTDDIPKKKIVPVNFHHVLFSLLDFLTHEAGIYRSFRNVGMVLPICARVSHMTIWCFRTWFDTAWSGSEQSGLVQSGSALHT